MCISLSLSVFLLRVCSNSLHEDHRRSVWVHANVRGCFCGFEIITACKFCSFAAMMSSCAHRARPSCAPSASRPPPCPPPPLPPSSCRASGRVFGLCDSRASTTSGLARLRPLADVPPRAPSPDVRSRRGVQATQSRGCCVRSRSPRSFRERSDEDLSRWICRICRYPWCASVIGFFVCVLCFREL